MKHSNNHQSLKPFLSLLFFPFPFPFPLLFLLAAVPLHSTGISILFLLRAAFVLSQLKERRENTDTSHNDNNDRKKEEERNLSFHLSYDNSRLARYLDSQLEFTQPSSKKDSISTFTFLPTETPITIFSARIHSSSSLSLNSVSAPSTGGTNLDNTLKEKEEKEKQIEEEKERKKRKKRREKKK